MEWFNFSWVSDPEAWVALVTLVILELVLGVDNVIFISILAGKLPEAQRDSARRTGIAMAVISWIIGTSISVGLAPLFSAQLGLALIKIPLQYHYSLVGAVVWFFILLGIAATASLVPARNAVRLTVREVLAYE